MSPGADIYPGSAVQYRRPQVQADGALAKICQHVQLSQGGGHGLECRQPIQMGFQQFLVELYVSITKGAKYLSRARCKPVPLHGGLEALFIHFNVFFTGNISGDLQR